MCNFCCFQHYVKCALSPYDSCSVSACEHEALKHLREAGVQQVIVCKRMEQVRGVQIALWDGPAGQRNVNWSGCHFYAHLIYCSPWWIAGGSVTVFTRTSQDVSVFVCLRQRGWFAPSLLCTNLPLNGNTSLAIILSPSWEHAESLSPPVITLKTAGRARKKAAAPACQTLFSLSNCSAHIRRITGVILLYNHRLLSSAYSFLAQFVCLCSHFGNTNVLLSCQPSDLRSRQLHLI